METVKNQTIGEWLEELVKADSTTEQDSREMENLLRRVNFPKAAYEGVSLRRRS